MNKIAKDRAINWNHAEYTTHAGATATDSVHSAEIVNFLQPGKPQSSEMLVAEPMTQASAAKIFSAKSLLLMAIGMAVVADLIEFRTPAIAPEATKDTTSEIYTEALVTPKQGVSDQLTSGSAFTYFHKTEQPTSSIPISFESKALMQFDDSELIIKGYNSSVGTHSETSSDARTKTAAIPLKSTIIPAIAAVIAGNHSYQVQLESATYNQISADAEKSEVIDSTSESSTLTANPFNASATSFTKYDGQGNRLTDDTQAWSCVTNEATALMWEVKDQNGGLRDSRNSYSWYNQDQQHGLTDGGRCEGGIDCDTSSYIQAVNEHALCGYSDWRLPTREEMETLIDHTQQTTNGKIDSEYFPASLPSWYWTGTSNPESPEYAWYVSFRNGVELNDLKERPKHVRLVRDNPQLVAGLL